MYTHTHTPLCELLYSDPDGNQPYKKSSAETEFKSIIGNNKLKNIGLLKIHIWFFIFLPPSHFLFVTPQLENKNSANKINKIDFFIIL